MGKIELLSDEAAFMPQLGVQCTGVVKRWLPERGRDAAVSAMMSQYHGKT